MRTKSHRRVPCLALEIGLSRRRTNGLAGHTLLCGGAGVDAIYPRRICKRITNMQASAGFMRRHGRRMTDLIVMSYLTFRTRSAALRNASRRELVTNAHNRSLMAGGIRDGCP